MLFLDLVLLAKISFIAVNSASLEMPVIRIFLIKSEECCQFSFVILRSR